MLEYSLIPNYRKISLPTSYNPWEINFFSPEGQQGTQDTDRESLEALSSPESRTSLNQEEQFYCNLIGLDQDQLLELMKNPGDLLDDAPNFSEMGDPEIPQHSPFLKAIARFLTNTYHNSYTLNYKAIQLFRIAMSFYELEAAQNIAEFSNLNSRENFAQLYADMRDDFFKSIIKCPYDISQSNEHGFDCSPEQSKAIIEAAINKIRDFAEIFSPENPDEFLVEVFQGANLDRTTSTGYTQEDKLKLSNHFTNLENADEMLEFFEESGFEEYYKFLLAES